MNTRVTNQTFEPADVDEPTQEFEVLCGATFGALGPALGIVCTKPAGHDDLEHVDDSFTIERLVPHPTSTTYRVAWEIVDVVDPLIPASRGDAVLDDR